MTDLVERVAIAITKDENFKSTNMTRAHAAIAECFKWRPIGETEPIKQGILRIYSVDFWPSEPHRYVDIYMPKENKP